MSIAHNESASMAVINEGNIFAEFLQTSGLYDSIEINEENIADLISLLNGDAKISVFCNECKTERVYTMSPICYFTEDEDEDKYVKQKLSETVHTFQKLFCSLKSEYGEEIGGEWQWKNNLIDEITRIIVFNFHCTMNYDHRLDYVVLTNNKFMKKIGQFPTVADLTFPELDEYKKVLSTKDRKELGRAIGLYASGIGVGSYVYLRRILERVVDKAKDYAVADGKITEEQYSLEKFVDRIKLLSDYLPAMLVNNTTVYGIISKGIHELSEEECIKYFPVLKECIYMILGEWEEKRKKREQETALTAALSKITSNIR